LATLYLVIVTAATEVDVRESNPGIGESARAFSADAPSAKTPTTDEPEPARTLIIAPC
jgi:hypothetical protein